MGQGKRCGGDELHRVITASVRELLKTAELEAQTGTMDAAQVERLIFRATAPIVHSVVPLTEPSAANCFRMSSG